MIAGRSRLSAAVLALVAMGASATELTEQMVAEREGRRLQAYLDGVRVATICDGHTEGVRLGDTATPEQCDAFRRSDVGVALAAVARLVKVPIPETTRAALGSWTLNVGQGNAARSTLIAKLNAGDRPGACDELRRWVFAGGLDCRIRSNNCRGIADRREAERELCLLG